MADDAATAPTPPMITHLCQVCGLRTTYWCSRCHGVWYCSVEHMQGDWPNHKIYCRPHDGTDSSMSSSSSQDPSPVSPYATLNNPSDGSGRAYSSRSSGSKRSAYSLGSGAKTNNSGLPSSVVGSRTTTEFNSVLFPCGEERPRIVRIPCIAQTQASGPTIWTPMPQEQLGGISDITSMIITHGIGGAPLRFPLHLFYGTNSFGDGSDLNQAIHRMTAGKATYPWAGNIVALKFSGARRQGYTDATYNDVAPLIASFLARPNETQSSN